MKQSETLKHKVRRGYDPGIPSRLTCTGESRTLQSHKDECDINNIMRQWTKTGVITHGQKKEPVFADVFDVPDYQNHLNQILAADEAFQALPAAVRKVFDNDPAKFVEGIDKPEHKEILTKLGILREAESTEDTDDATKPAAPPSQPLGQPLPETSPDVPEGGR